MAHRRVVNDSDARYTRWLLRPSGQRPRRRPAEKRDELAPFPIVQMHRITGQPGLRAGYTGGRDRSVGCAAFTLDRGGVRQTTRPCSRRDVLIKQRSSRAATVGDDLKLVRELSCRAENLRAIVADLRNSGYTGLRDIAAD